MTVSEQWQKMYDDECQIALEQDHHHYHGILNELEAVLSSVWEEGGSHQEVLSTLLVMHFEDYKGRIVASLIPPEAGMLPETAELKAKYPEVVTAA